jgi:hypothetical protein
LKQNTAKKPTFTEEIEIAGSQLVERVGALILCSRWCRRKSKQPNGFAFSS